MASLNRLVEASRAMGCKASSPFGKPRLPRAPVALPFTAKGPRIIFVTRAGVFMGLRFRKSVRIARGMRVNLTGHGMSSVSFGRPGSTLNFGRTGVRGTVGVPGSGLSYSSRLSAGSALGLGLVIAFFTALFIQAARGNRLAQAVLVAIGLAGTGFLLFHPERQASVPIAMRTVEPDSPAIVMTSPQGNTGENAAPESTHSTGASKTDAPVSSSIESSKASGKFEAPIASSGIPNAQGQSP